MPSSRARSPRPSTTASSRSATTEAQRQRGFSLTELAVVMLIVGLLLGGMMFTFSTQVDQSNRQETQRRLEYARELLIAFAIVNGRLPCPATSGSSAESPSGGGTCTDYYTGYLPGSTLGFQPVDLQGYALDAWNNRIRYAVAQNIVSGSTPHFTNSTNLKANGIATQPNDLVVCYSASGTQPGANPPSCGTAVSVTNQRTLAAVIWTLGKNSASATTSRPDENANNKSASNANDAVFVHRSLTSVDSPLGEFDDMMVWLPASQLYARLVSAGVLP